MTTIRQLLDTIRDGILNGHLAPDTPVRVQTAYERSTWEWELQGAHGTGVGPARELVLELRAPTLKDDGEAADTAGPRSHDPGV
jgi:DNA-binding GntR family transcriptional regulator